MHLLLAALPVAIIFQLAFGPVCFTDATNTIAAPPSEGDHGRPRPLVSKECTFCICKDRGCKNENTTCDSSIASMYSAGCGLFQMTLAYWIDGGNQSVTGESAKNESAFECCAKDYKCAARTLENYMQRYQKDCNGDKKINCADFAAIHRAGAGACNETAGQESAKNVTECLKTQGEHGFGHGHRPMHGPHGPRPEEESSTHKAETKVYIDTTEDKDDSEEESITSSKEDSKFNEDADSKSGSH